MSLTESSSCAARSLRADACILEQLCLTVAMPTSATDCTSASIDGPLCCTALHALDGCR